MPSWSSTITLVSQFRTNPTLNLRANLPDVLHTFTDIRHWYCSYCCTSRPCLLLSWLSEQIMLAQIYVASFGDQTVFASCVYYILTLSIWVNLFKCFLLALLEHFAETHSALHHSFWWIFEREAIPYCVVSSVAGQVDDAFSATCALACGTFGRKHRIFTTWNITFHCNKQVIEVLKILL